jgi:hypothetical protein
MMIPSSNLVDGRDSLDDTLERAGDGYIAANEVLVVSWMVLDVMMPRACARCEKASY